jgi:HK97 family phage major capsid protein
MNEEIQKELEKLFGAAGEKTKAVIKTEVAEALSKVITADELEKRLKAVSVDPKVIEKLQEAIEKQGLELTTFLEGKKNDEQTLSSVLYANKEKLQAIAKNGREAAFKIVLPASIARKTLVERSAVSSSTQAMRLTEIGQLDYVNAVIKPLFRSVQISPDSNGVIRYVDESTATRNADVKAEAAEAPESVQAWTERSLNLYKIMDSIPVTMEAFKDVNFIEGEINRLLNINMTLKEDSQLYSGSGVAPNLKGLYTSATDTLFGAGSYNQSVDNANVYDLIAALRSAMMGGK